VCVATVIALPRADFWRRAADASAATDRAPGGGSAPDSTRPYSSLPESGDLATRLAAGRAVIDGIDFIGSSDTLDPASDPALSRLAVVLRKVPGTFLVEAHVPPSGDVIADQAMTDRRAAVVMERLIAAGVPASRLLAMGFGAARAAEREGRARIELSRMP